jgi:transposase
MPPGAQAQVDWAQFPGVVVAGQAITLQAFHMVLSHSRMDAVVWMPGQDQLSWLAGHNRAFERLGGIPAVVRVENTKTAVVRGAGPWGQLNETYRRYALTVRFHIDPCQPYSPEHKVRSSGPCAAIAARPTRRPDPGATWPSCRPQPTPR